MWKKNIREKIFGCFYIHFCKKGIDFLKETLYQYNLEEDDITEEIIAKNCYRQIKGLPVRVLIYEMQQNVEKNNLKILDERKGYDYYNEHFLTDEAYLQTLNVKYPELFRLLSLRMKQTVILLCDILSAIKDDADYEDEICLCHGRSGNLMILKKYLEKIPSNKSVDEKIKYLLAEIVEMFEKEDGYRISERFQPGFMNGMTGVGMMLLAYDMT